MKIKTMTKKISPEGLAEFDRELNNALAEGWRLVKREVLPGVNLGHCYFAPSLYAELALLDPEPEAPAEPETVGPVEALHIVKEFCRTVEKCIDCPLVNWCKDLQKGGDPTDWKIPEKEADA